MTYNVFGGTLSLTQSIMLLFFYVGRTSNLQDRAVSSRQMGVLSRHLLGGTPPMCLVSPKCADPIYVLLALLQQTSADGTTAKSATRGVLLTLKNH